ncbi:MAG: hypothetical protein AAF763_11520 [Pseudomonadota bacterium]
MFSIIADTLFAALGRAPEPTLPPRRRAEPPKAAKPVAAAPRSGAETGPCA